MDTEEKNRRSGTYDFCNLAFTDEKIEQNKYLQLLQQWLLDRYQSEIVSQMAYRHPKYRLFRHNCVFLFCFCRQGRQNDVSHWIKIEWWEWKQWWMLWIYPTAVSKYPDKYFLKSPNFVFPKSSLWANLLPLEYMYTCGKMRKQWLTLKLNLRKNSQAMLLGLKNECRMWVWVRVQHGKFYHELH